MQVFTPTKAEQILIGDDVTITITHHGSDIRVGIDAPHDLRIRRQNVLTSPPTPLPLEVETWPVVTVSDKDSYELARQRNPAA